MAFIWSNAGEGVLLDWCIRGTGQALKLKLYSNDTTPTDSSILTDFTECTFTGYSEKELLRSLWSAPSSVSGVAESSYAEQSWLAGSSQTIYGYYFVSATGGAFLGAERITPVSMIDGKTFGITPKISLRTFDPL